MNDYQHISLFVIFRIIFEITFFVFFFWLSREYLVKFLRDIKWRKRLTFYIPIARNIFWFFYAFYIFSYLLNVNVILAGITFVFLMLIFWKSIINLIYGIVYKIQNGNVYGSQITINEFSGLIVSLKNTKMEVESEAGKIFQFPYVSLFAQKVSIPTIGKSMLINLKYELKNHLSEQDVFNLKKQILCSPYVINPSALSVEVYNLELKKMLSIKLLVLNSKYIDSLKSHVDTQCEKLIN